MLDSCCWWNYDNFLLLKQGTGINAVQPKRGIKIDNKILERDYIFSILFFSKVISFEGVSYKLKRNPNKIKWHGPFKAIFLFCLFNFVNQPWMINRKMMIVFLLTPGTCFKIIFPTFIGKSINFSTFNFTFVSCINLGWPA